MKKMLYYILQQGGGNIKNLLNVYFSIYFINFFISLYSIYTFIDIYLFHNLQGSKLNLKISQKKDDYH